MFSLTNDNKLTFLIHDETIVIGCGEPDSVWEPLVHGDIIISNLVPCENSFSDPLEISWEDVAEALSQDIVSESFKGFYFLIRFSKKSSKGRQWLIPHHPYIIIQIQKRGGTQANLSKAHVRNLVAGGKCCRSQYNSFKNVVICFYHIYPMDLQHLCFLSFTVHLTPLLWIMLTIIFIYPQIQKAPHFHSFVS